MNRINPKIEFKTFTLEDGLKVILSVNKKIPSVSQNITFKVGSKNDFKGRSGIAHLLEHLMFEGFQNKYELGFDEIDRKSVV